MTPRGQPVRVPRTRVPDRVAASVVSQHLFEMLQESVSLCFEASRYP